MTINGGGAGVINNPGTGAAASAYVPGNNLPYLGSTLADWDTITIGLYTFTGCKITIDGTPEYKVDCVSPAGTDGASLKPKGYVAAKLGITVEIFSNLDNTNDPDALVEEWFRLIAAYRPIPGKTILAPVTIDHPLLKKYRMSRFLILATPFPKSNGYQSWEARLGVQEYFPKPKDAGTQKPSAVTGDSVYNGNLTGANAATPAAATGGEPGGGEYTADPSTNNTNP